MRKALIIIWVLAVVLGLSAGLFWVRAAGQLSAPVTDLEFVVQPSPQVVPSQGFISVNCYTAISGGPADATFTFTLTDARGGVNTAQIVRTLRQNGVWQTNIPLVPVGSVGTGFLDATMTAGGLTVHRRTSLTITGGDFTLAVAQSGAQLSQYPGQPTTLVLTTTVSNDPSASLQPPPVYNYQWQAIANDQSGQALQLLSGGGSGDKAAVYAIPGGAAGSSQPYVVSCLVTNQYGLKAVGGAMVNVRLLGDINGDGYVDQNDLNILNARLNGFIIYPQADADCDLNGNGAVTTADRVILRRIINGLQNP